jgi:hypothetical protein
VSVATEARITPTVVTEVTRAAVLTAQTLRDAGDPWLKAVHATMRALIHRVAAAQDLPLDKDELPYTRVPGAETLLDGLGPLTGWTPLTIGDLHQELLPLQLRQTAGSLEAVRPKGATTRDLQGSWYTPQPVAQAMTRMALEIAIGQMPADDPDQVLRLRAVDPACGAGVFLIEGARKIASAYAQRLAGTPEAPPHLMRKILPEVIYRCVYGMDIDPVAVDLARMSLWLEVDGRPPFGWLDGNIACLNPLEGPNSLPTRLLDAMGEKPLDSAA